MTNEPQVLSTQLAWTRKIHLFGEAGEYVLQFDWAKTELGALESWPSALVLVVELTLSSRIPVALAIGPQRRLIANSHALELLGSSELLTTGGDAVVAFSLFWPDAQKAVELAASGEVVNAKSQLFRPPNGRSFLVDVDLAPLQILEGELACVQVQFVKTGPQEAFSFPAGDDRISVDVAENGDWVAVSPQWTIYTGLSQEESKGLGWLNALHPDDRGIVESSWMEAQGRGEFSCDVRIFEVHYNRYRRRRTRAYRRRTCSGIAKWSATSVDIDDLFSVIEEQEDTLVEARRRTRNTLGIVRSIARRTAETSDSVESCAMHFEGRLDALARVGSLTVGNQSSGVSLETLVAEELFSFKAREDAGLQISGPRIRIRPEAAEMLGLAIHELATNAVKFGALSLAGGRLEITWRKLERDSDALVLSWIESGVAVSSDLPRVDGFGADLIKRGLVYALNARTQLVLQADGLNCSIELPATIFLE